MDDHSHEVRGTWTPIAMGSREVPTRACPGFKPAGGRMFAVSVPVMESRNGEPAHVLKD